MSERTLDNVIRNLRMAASYLDTAELMADQVLANHKIASEIKLLKMQVKDYTQEELNLKYRESHYQRRRRK